MARFILWVILPLVCIELLMVVLDPYLFKGIYQYDSDLGFRIRSYARNSDGTLTNQFGFNDQDYPLQKAPGTLRFLMVGDSFGWTGGRDGNYTALLEQKFERHYGHHKIDVINAGYPRTHTGEQLAMLKKYGLQYNPDLVVLGFFVGNDFIDADPTRKRIIVNGLYTDIKSSEEYKILGYPIIPQSRLLLFVKQKYRIYTELSQAERERGDRPGQQAAFSEETFLLVEGKRLEFFNISAARQGRFQPNIDYILQSISEMEALLRARNIGLVVAIYPDEFQVNENLLKTIFERFKFRPDDYDLNLAQNLLKSHLQSKGIPFIDMSDRFRAEAKRQELYLWRNTHWNTAGRQLAADILFEELLRQAETQNP